jgi:hypothetical protein
MLVDHFTVEYAVMGVAYQHQVARIMGELGRENGIATGAINGIGYDVADVGRVGVGGSGNLVADQ